MIRKSLAVAGLVLVVFHGWLFAGQVWNGQMAGLALAARWLVAVGLLLALRHLRQQRASMFRGRKAIAVWLLAALLHGPVVAEQVGFQAPSMPELVAVLAPVATSTALAGLFALLALALAARRRTAQPIRHGFAFDAVLFGPLAFDSYPTSAPRPPPRLEM